MGVSNPKRRRTRRSLVLLILLLMLLVAGIFCCGQISLLTLRPNELGIGVKPRVTADYGPWPWVELRPLDPVLVTLLVEEQATLENSTGTAPAMVVLPTLPKRTATPVPVSPVPTDSPAGPDAPPTDAPTDPPPLRSSPAAPVDTETPRPTSTTAPSATATTAAPTASPTGTLSPTPTPTLTFTPSATTTATLTPTNTPLPSATLFPAPVASFYANPPSVNLPAAITFMNSSTGFISSYSWNFGDGIGYSADVNPAYTYPNPGTYTVTLTATGPGGSSTYSAAVTALQSPPVASFFANPPLGAASLYVTFANTSTGTITAYSWNFGDGIGSSTQANPSYTYTSPGSYPATLTVFGPGGSSSTTVYIYVYPPPTPTPTPTRRPTRTPTPTPTPTNTPTPTDTPGAASDLAVSKSVSNPAPPEDTTVTFTVTITNNGPDTASGVAITDNLPGGVTPVSASPDQGSYAGGVWTIDTLANGASAVLDLMVSVDSGTAGSTITNTADITASDQTDPDPANNSASAAIIPVPPVTGPTADLSITKTVDNPNPREGYTLSYWLQVTNNGPDNADGIQVTDILPAGASYMNQGGPGTYDPGTGLWVINSALSAGQTAQKRIDVRVEPGTAGTDVTNTAVITALNQTDPNPANDTASVSFHVIGADLSISKTVSNPNPHELDNVTFTVTLTNNGPDATDGITVSDALPGGLSLGPVVASQGTYDGSSWWVGSLANSASATLTLTAQVNSGTMGSTLTNTATITAAAEIDPIAANNSASASVIVTPVTLGADLRVTKSVDNEFPYPGDSVTFTVTLRNNGPVTATGIVVLDVIPAGLMLVGNTPSQGNYATGLWLVGALGPGNTATLTLSVQVNSGTGGSMITNTAWIIAADQFDPHHFNNIDSANIFVQIPPLPPVAHADSAAPVVDTPAIINVLANDTDPDGNIDPGSVTIVTPPTNGTINGIDGATGAITFQSSVVGPDSFTYQVCDTTLLCASAVVSVDVTP